MTRDEYISKYSNLAIDTTSGTGLLPSVMLAQAIVESRNGNSELSEKYNNHFGIKADSSWDGKKINMNTREVISGNNVMMGDFFRVYPSAKASYKDRVKFLTENPRYKKAGVFEAKTPLAQLQALQRAGYATDPQYAIVLNSILEQENLGALDTAIRFARKNWIPISIAVVGLVGIIIVIVKNRK